MKTNGTNPANIETVKHAANAVLVLEFEYLT